QDVRVLRGPQALGLSFIKRCHWDVVELRPAAVKSAQTPRQILSRWFSAAALLSSHAGIQDLQTIRFDRSLPAKMNAATPERRDESTSKPLAIHARSLPSSRPFNVAAFFSALHYVGIVTTLTSLVLIFTDPSVLSRNV